MKDEPIILNPPKKRRKKSWGKNINMLIFVIVILVLVVAIPYYIFVPRPEVFKLQQYEMAQVTPQDFVLSVLAKGKVMAAEKSQITAPIEGNVVKVLCQEGDVVEQGALLVELASDSLKEELKKAEAQYQKKLTEKNSLKLENEQKLKEVDQQIENTKKLAAKLESELPTWRKLYELGEISKMALEDYEKKAEEAYLAINQAIEMKTYTIRRHLLAVEETENIIVESQKTITELKKQLESGKIKAEVPGKIVSLSVKVGDMIRSGVAIAEVINEKSLLVNGEVPISAIKDVKVAQIVNISLGGQNYSGKVTYISAIAKESIVPINVEFDEIPTNLRSDSSVSLDIQIGVLKDRLALPRRRYLTSGQERYVYVIAGEKAVKKEIIFGLVNDNYIEIKTGLAKGDKIIVSSYDNYIHLDEIKINPEGGKKI